MSDKPGEKLYIALVIFDLFVEITFCTKRYVETLLFEVEDYLAGDRSLLNPAGNIWVVPACQLNELSHPVENDYESDLHTHEGPKVGGHVGLAFHIEGWELFLEQINGIDRVLQGERALESSGAAPFLF